MNINYLKCKECENGNYILRVNSTDNCHGRRYFGGCDNYPRCKSTISGAEFCTRILKHDGINIYQWQKKCPKCNENTHVISYYFYYDFKEYHDDIKYLAGVGIGDIPFLDKILIKKYKNVKLVKSNTLKTEYVANTCEYCGCLQGHFYVVEDPHEIFDELYVSRGMDKYLLEHIDLSNTFIPYEDIKNLL